MAEDSVLVDIYDLYLFCIAVERFTVLAVYLYPLGPFFVPLRRARGWIL
jgi:hypothetical protein